MPRCARKRTLPIVEPGSSWTANTHRAAPRSTRHCAPCSRTDDAACSARRRALKPNMVIPAKFSGARRTRRRTATVNCCAVVPARCRDRCSCRRQSDEEATANLAINARPAPWPVSFSRPGATGCRRPVAGRRRERGRQKAFLHRAQMNGLARRKWTPTPKRRLPDPMRPRPTIVVGRRRTPGPGRALRLTRV
jgi:fructose-bisphosphate aldolase class 1